jgi:hypothetical protein
LSSRDADDSSIDVELPSPLAELSAELSGLVDSLESSPSPPLLSEEISSDEGSVALLLSSQAVSVKASAAAANPQAIFKRRCFMASFLF